MTEQERQEAELLTTEEVAALLKVSPATLVDWRYKKEGPRYLKKPHMVRYKLADIVKWLQQGFDTVDPTAL